MSPPRHVAPAPSRIARTLARWFAGAARPLPWRIPDPATGRRNPYHSLVSEFMLQQTQVSRVMERWPGFLARFPTVEALAGASEDDVLAAWSGMGYYRRARLLHAAARRILADHRGVVPADPAALRELPGVGPYTAGAIASIAYGMPVAAVDGNVARVLLRLHARPAAHASRQAAVFAFGAASLIAESAAGLPGGPGAVNEAMMELGATVCTPRRPSCKACPLAAVCGARGLGLQHKIPSPKPAAARRVVYATVALAKNAAGQVLVERRPPSGMWAGLWQAPTVETDAPLSAADAGRRLGVRLRNHRTSFTHLTTHRTVRFAVWDADAAASTPPDRFWRTRAQVARLAISNPQRTVLLGAGPGKPTARGGGAPAARRRAPARPGSPRSAAATSAGRPAR